MRGVTARASANRTEQALSPHETDATPDIDLDVATHVPQTFAALGVLPATVDALAADGIVTAFPIQELTLPLALAGNDLIGQAKTGTGKTLGFGIPALQRLVAPQDDAWATLAHAGKPQALVVVPTRELGIQVAGDLEKAGRLRGVRVLCVYGGRAYEPQVDALQKGVEVVVGTPGRLIDLARQGHLDLSHVRTLVLDEADEMLDMGFLPDVERIVAQVPPVRQTMLFSATMPGQIVALARRYMTQPTHIRAIDPNDAGATVDKIEQHVWRAHSLDKQELIARVLQAEGRGLTMIFCRTKRNAQRVADDLAERGFAAAAVHGDLGQGAREQALRAFRNGKVDVLVATDVAARGIDVADVTHVINWECPEDDKTYLHRIGRTGRAGSSGVAITLVDWDDLHRWKMINDTLGLPFQEPLETYSSSPHVYTGLGIPEGTKGRLPKTAQTRAGLDAEVLEDLGETGASKGRRSRSGKDGHKDGHKRDGHGDRHRDKDRHGDRDKDRHGDRDKHGHKDAHKDKHDKHDKHGERSEHAGDGEVRRSRQRRRTRSGESVEGVAPAPETDGDSPVGEAAGTAAPRSADDASTGEGTAKRRRRRGGRGRGRSGGEAAGSASDAPAAPEPAGISADD